MKFTVEGALFKQRIAEVSKVLNSKNTLQILQNMLFEVKGDTLFITGSDTDNTLKVEMPVAESDGDISVCINARILLDTTKEISAQPIKFEINESNFAVDMYYFNGQFQFMGIDGVEFPRPKDSAETSDSYNLRLPAEVVKKGIERTKYACATDTLRPAMMGIFWDIHKEDITFVASDTHKLVRYINKEVKPEIEVNFIMGAKPAGVLAGLISEDMEYIDMHVNGRRATFQLGTSVLVCQFINGTYPNYNRVIPQDNPYVVELNRAQLLSALRRVSIFANKASNMVRFDLGKGRLRLEGRDMDFGTFSEESVICEFEGPEMSIGFNATFTIDIIQNFPGETVVIEVSDPARPGVFHPLEKSDVEDIITIQMPIQVLDR